MSTIIIDRLYQKVSDALSDKERYTKFKKGIDTFLADNINKLNVMGPLKQIAFPQSKINELISTLNLTMREIDEVKREVKKATSVRVDYIDLTLYIPLALATRFFLIKRIKAAEAKDANGVTIATDDIRRCIYYTAVPMYALLQKKYFKKCEPNEACMQYAISNMIEKNRIRQTGSMLDTIYITTGDCMTFYEERLIQGKDETIIDYLNGVRTRLNSIIRNISNAYYIAFNEGKYVKSEVDDLSDNNYYEHDSNSQFIDRASNKVVQVLITNGPDMKLVEIAAKNNSMSVSDLRSFVATICTDKYLEELRDVIESLYVLFLNSRHSIMDTGNDKFLLFALNVYKKSNTKDAQILHIKDILDKWLKDLHVYERTGTVSTLNCYRRAIYMFIVMEMIKLNK